MLASFPDPNDASIIPDAEKAAVKRIAVVLLAISLLFSLGAARAAARAPAHHAVITAEKVVAAPNVMNPQRDVVTPRVTVRPGAAHAAMLTASVTIRRIIPRWRAYVYALHQQGKWYCWGGAGPSCYDCSGLVVASYASVGIWLPHNTYQMLSSGKLRWIPQSQAKAGDLVFMYGGGHVEFVTTWWRFPAYGAHTTGTQIGFDDWSNVYGFYHVIGSG